MGYLLKPHLNIPEPKEEEPKPNFLTSNGDGIWTVTGNWTTVVTFPSEGGIIKYSPPSAPTTLDKNGWPKK